MYDVGNVLVWTLLLLIRICIICVWRIDDFDITILNSGVFRGGEGGSPPMIFIFGGAL